ncbi:MAG TPA: hypothetical protein VGO50_12965 [Pyrinomonadaceae bacterium]|jgi:hypothetical protein|nr:hypothetical protein [Pyrinomonadaceae bacterium]
MLSRSLQLSFLLAVLAVLALSYSAVAAQNRNVRINFPRGAAQATKSGAVKGYETVTYTFRVRNGQSVRVKLTSGNPNVYFSFNGAGGAIRSWEGSVHENGDYRVTVFLFHNAARRGTRVNYSLNVRAGWITP